MKHHSIAISAAIAVALLSACASTPENTEELSAARTLVPQVESSPRAGVAASNISEARQSLDHANKLADKGGNSDDLQHAATVAMLNAQIANEKILAAEAKESIDKGTAERQAVQIEVRERETRQAAQRAAGLEQELADLKATKTDRGIVVTLGDVLFDTGKATLKPGAYGTIDRLASALKGSADRSVLIEGHTDSVGSDEYNQNLSEHRAASVQSALLERGATPNQITTAGRGESTPVASNDNAGGRQQNRRVEMIFNDAATPRVASDGKSQR